MNTFIEKIKTIKEKLTILDDSSYDTIEEAKASVLKYDSLLNDLINLVLEIIQQNNLSSVEKEELYTKSVSLLTNYIGSAEDTEKFETIFNNLYENKKISKNQLDFFFDNLNIGRWE